MASLVTRALRRVERQPVRGWKPSKKAVLTTPTLKLLLNAIALDTASVAFVLSFAEVFTTLSAEPKFPPASRTRSWLWPLAPSASASSPATLIWLFSTNNRTRLVFFLKATTLRRCLMASRAAAASASSASLASSSGVFLAPLAGALALPLAVFTPSSSSAASSSHGSSDGLIPSPASIFAKVLAPKSVMTLPERFRVTMLSL
mmetsp:Transcript_17626/g.24755  ORF Transcript_17626/g.24755 Transcript_17626/m.24755 type:complete len:203 (+) Transcript_17626:242-850(+)